MVSPDSIVTAEDEIVDSIGYWTKDVTGMPGITDEFLNTYFTAEATDA